MNIPEELEKLTGMLNQLYADADEALSNADPETAQRISDALAQVKQNQAPFFAGVTSMKAEADQNLAKAQQISQDSEQQVQQVRKRYEEAKAAKEKPPEAPPKPKADPDRAEKVNDELLERFGGPPPPQTAPADYKDVWEDPSWTPNAERISSQAEPKSDQPNDKPAPKRDKSSASWDDEEWTLE